VAPLRDGDVLAKALEYAVEMHGEQVRKGGDVPYVSHLLAVAAMVLEDGGGAKDAAAALLHDVVEDTPATLDDVRVRFGGYVERIVRGCSDSLVHEGKQEWRARKEAYLQRLPTEPPEVLRVSVADKLHNARSILHDLEREGVGTLDRFKGGREGTLWYYRSVLEVYHSIDGLSSRWLDNLDEVVERMSELAGT
jgi:(p)ppGpp synthase/HD superfamily hydrolase